jgi:hypothetical protein
MLNNARALLLRPDGWTQGTLMRDMRTKLTILTDKAYDSTVPAYVQVCAIGSIELTIACLNQTGKYRNNSINTAAYYVLQRLHDLALANHPACLFDKYVRQKPIVVVNDYCGLSATLALFDRAILDCAEELCQVQAGGLTMAQEYATIGQ